MKTLLGVSIGITAVILWHGPIRRALIRYSEHSLPAPYVGPKVAHWRNGVRQPN